MVLTHKLRHNLNLDESLFKKAILVAEYALEHGYVSSKEVKHIGLNSGIANQIIRKYGRDKKIKR